MINAQVIKISKTKEAVFSLAFTAAAVYTPTLIHYFAGMDGGRTYLPMPFFVLAAGLLLGWRAGLATGLFSPIISFLLSGMPMLAILPIITVQLSVYGFLAGMLKEKYNGFLSVAGAIVFGLILTGVAVLIFSKMNAAAHIMNAVRDGWPGIAIQLVALPLACKFSKKYLLSVY